MKENKVLAPTPHNKAKNGDYAKTVIMCGDPKRCDYIAQKFLDNSVLINDVRGITAYTGAYKGKKVSVMAHGMGMPSMGIYSHELFNFYGVNTIIRVGSAGAVSKDLNLGELIVSEKAYTLSNFGRTFSVGNKEFFEGDAKLISKALKTAKKLNISAKLGNSYCSDRFYDTKEEFSMVSKGVNVVDMESYALYITAQEYKKKALCLLTVSDILYKETPVRLSPEERAGGFDSMVRLALEMV